MTIVALFLALIVGLAVGLLGGGGSILTVPIFVYFLRMEVQPAIATSLIIVAVVSLVSAAQHYQKGRVQLKVGLVFGAAAMMGAYGGGRAAHFFPGEVLMLFFALMMGMTAFGMLRGRPEGSLTALDKTVCQGPRCLRMAAVGLLVGVITGLVGTGGGFLIVPALVLLGGVPIKEAIGTSLLVIALNALAGFAGHLSHVSIDWHLATMFAMFAVGGSFLGVLAMNLVSAERLRRGFAYFVLTMAMVILATNVKG